MNSFEMNKIIGAILGTLLLVMGVGFLAEAIYAPIEGRGQGYALPVADASEGHGGEAVEVQAVPLADLLASASAENGARVSRKCQSCHNFGEGDGNKTGPALYNIVGASIAANADFSYSDALTGMAGDGGIWTYEALDEFLKSPRTYAPGTKMTFAGLSKEQDRVDMLAYLRTLSAAPIDFPPTDFPVTEGSETVSAEAAPIVEAVVETAIEEVAPVVEEAVEEVVEETAPIVEEAAPVVEETTPVVEETTPVVEEVTPVVEETTPVVEETTPTVEEAAPVTEEAAPVAEEAAPANSGEASAIAMLLATGDAQKGERVFRKCKSCHNSEEGAGNKVGPNLYDIVGATIAVVPDFKYSDTLVGMGADGGIWTYENLQEFLTKPRNFAPGTKMSFSGLRKEEDMANILAYLQSLSASPVAFPE